MRKTKNRITIGPAHVRMILGALDLGIMEASEHARWFIERVETWHTGPCAIRAHSSQRGIKIGYHAFKWVGADSQTVFDGLTERVDTRRGAPMGRGSSIQFKEYADAVGRPTPFQSEPEPWLPVFDRKVPLTDGYDRGGAYWGWPNNLRVRYTSGFFHEFYRS